MLKAQGLRAVRDGQEILANVDVIVEPGESLAVTGPSGSGKTTLLALLSGLARPTAGEVYIDGKPLTKFAGPALGVAVVLQGYGLVSLLTAAENIEVALRAAGRSPGVATRTAREILAHLGLEAHADQLVEELSGGQQQRTAVARALALEPRLLIADEPTAELDPAARAVALARMFEIAVNGGSLVLATHDPEVAARCDRILDLSEGSASVAALPIKAPLDQAELDQAELDQAELDQAELDQAELDQAAQDQPPARPTALELPSTGQLSADQLAADQLATGQLPAIQVPTGQPRTGDQSLAGQLPADQPPSGRLAADQRPTGSLAADQAPLPAPEQQDRGAGRRSAPWRKPAHALPERLSSAVEEASVPAATGAAYPPPDQPPHPAIPPDTQPPSEPGYPAAELTPSSAAPPGSPAPQTEPGYGRSAWPQPHGDEPRPAVPPGQQLPPIAAPQGMSAQRDRLISSALPPLHRRGARLRNYLDDVQRRAAGAAAWLSARDQPAQQAESAGLPSGAAASADELELLRMARDDLAGFADLGLRLLELHQPMDLGAGTGDPSSSVPRCLSCIWRWPCPTFLTLAEIMESGPGQA